LTCIENVIVDHYSGACGGQHDAGCGSAGLCSGLLRDRSGQPEMGRFGCEIRADGHTGTMRTVPQLHLKMEKL